MQAAECDCDDIVIVDANIDEYESLIAEFRSRGFRAVWFTSGEETLRAAAVKPSTLWMINVRLADMSGLCLLSLVRCRIRRASIFLIGDSYSTEIERAARTAGATAYLCKPVSTAWLAACQPRCRSPAIRAGPCARTAVDSLRLA